MNPEEGFLGALLLAPARIGEAAAELDIDDMRTLPGRDIYGVMLTLHRRGIVPDLVTVATELDALRDAGDGQGPRSFPDAADLIHLQAEVPTVDYRRYVPQILDAGLRHRLRLATQDMAKMVEDRTSSAAEVYDQSRELLASIERPGASVDESQGADEFCAGEDTYDWLVPSLLERGDRLIVVAGESGGKSMLLRQVAMCCAFGIHPFRHGHGTPMRVALLDMENPESLARRKIRPMFQEACRMRPQANRNLLRIVCRPGGIDVNRRGDARWLAAQLDAIKPDLVVAGPLYKMFAADREGWESGAAKAAAVLDDLRTRLHFGLILETHAPQAAFGGARHLRPIGSSLWLRWPEFGLSFAPVEKHAGVVKVTMWKDRDERHWPAYLRRGGAWPWTPCRDPEGPLANEPPPPDPGPSGPVYEQEPAF